MGVCAQMQVPLPRALRHPLVWKSTEHANTRTLPSILMCKIDYPTPPHWVQETKKGTTWDVVFFLGPAAGHATPVWRLGTLTVRG
jgi:hypothetical protein